MEQQDDDLVGRRSLMAGMGIAVAGLVANTARAQTKSPRAAASFQPARHQLDAWFDQLPGNHRVFIDTGTANGGAEGLGYANNLYIARESAYAGEPADFAIVVCFRHFSTPFGYNDAIWAKYGEIFHSLVQYPDPATGAAPKINLMNSAAHKTLANRGVTIDALVAKGTKFAICNMATELISSVIAARTGGKANDVHDELVAGAIANSHFVSAGVMALTRAQEYGYSLLVAG
jgi:intracellular sulfur oxidation DsrE/DsrF family protein